MPYNCFVLFHGSAFRLILLLNAGSRCCHVLPLLPLFFDVATQFARVVALSCLCDFVCYASFGKIAHFPKMPPRNVRQEDLDVVGRRN